MYCIFIFGWNMTILIIANELILNAVKKKKKKEMTMLKREIMRFLGLLTRWFSFKHRSLLRTLLLILILSLVTSLYFVYYVMQSPSVTQRAKPPVPHIRCLSDPDLLNPEVQAPGKHKSNERLQLAHRALLVVEAPSSRNGRKIKHFLNSLRIDVKVVSKSKTFPPLSSKKSARYAVIVFENYNSYLKLDSWSRQLIDKYCRDYHVGIVGFIRPPREEGTHVSFVDGYQLTIQYKLELEDIKLNFDSYVWRVLKPGEVWKGFLPGKWAVFHSNHSTYQNLAYSRLSSHFLEFDASDDSYLHGFKYVTSVMDKGEIDGIPKILFGNDLNFWLHTVMMVDTLSYLSFGKLELSLDRYIQIDVDDIFVGKEGIRMTVDDVEVSANNN